MGRGELSFSKVRALTRKATAESERELVELARGVTTAQLERMLRAWEKRTRQDEAARERERHESRRLSIFPDGGETSYANCLPLCRHHHRLVHEGGWKVGWDGEARPIFFDPRGPLHYDGRWQPPQLPEDAVEALRAENVALGIEPNPWTPSARWEREADIPDDVYFGATEVV